MSSDDSPGCSETSSSSSSSFCSSPLSTEVVHQPAGLRALSLDGGAHDELDHCNGRPPLELTSAAVSHSVSSMTAAAAAAATIDSRGPRRDGVAALATTTTTTTTTAATLAPLGMESQAAFMRRSFHKNPRLPGTHRLSKLNGSSRNSYADSESENDLPDNALCRDFDKMSFSRGSSARQSLTSMRSLPAKTQEILSSPPTTLCSARHERRRAIIPISTRMASRVISNATGDLSLSHVDCRDFTTHVGVAAAAAASRTASTTIGPRERQHASSTPVLNYQKQHQQQRIVEEAVEDDENNDESNIILHNNDGNNNSSNNNNNNGNGKSGCSNSISYNKQQQLQQQQHNPHKHNLSVIITDECGRSPAMMVVASDALAGQGHVQERHPHHPHHPSHNQTAASGEHEHHMPVTFVTFKPLYGRSSICSSDDCSTSEGSSSPHSTVRRVGPAMPNCGGNGGGGNGGHSSGSGGGAGGVGGGGRPGSSSPDLLKSSLHWLKDHPACRFSMSSQSSWFSDDELYSMRGTK